MPASAARGARRMFRLTYSGLRGTIPPGPRAGRQESPADDLGAGSGRHHESHDDGLTCEFPAREFGPEVMGGHARRPSADARQVVPELTFTMRPAARAHDGELGPGLASALMTVQSRSRGDEVGGQLVKLLMPAGLGVINECVNPPVPPGRYAGYRRGR
jgi:hypothetical protein